MLDTIKEELFNHLTQDWKNAETLKSELKLSESNRSIGKILANITAENKNIVMRKRNNVCFYRLKTPLNIHVNRDDFTPEKPIMNELKTIITDLKEYGFTLEEIQGISYKALMEEKAKMDKEMKLVQEKAPLFKKQFDYLKRQVDNMSNQIEDLRNVATSLSVGNIGKEMDKKRKESQYIK